jgi:multiple sugar transport system substrate-binding protein
MFKKSQPRQRGGPMLKRDPRRHALRRIAANGAVGLIAAVVAACSGSTNSSGPVTLTMWDHVQSSKDVDAAYSKAAADFQKTHPNVKIKIQTFPFEQYQGKLLTAVKGGSGPDIMSLDEPWTPQFAESGVIQPIDSYVAKSNAVKADAFFPAAWETTLWKSKQWAVPLGFDVWEELLWNPDLFKSAGLDPNTPPKTWDELLTYAQKLTKGGVYGIVLPSAKSEVIPVFNNSFVYSNAGAIVDAGGKVVMNSPQNVKTYTFLYKDLIKYTPNGAASLDHGAAEALFTSGKVAMMFDGNWSQETMDAQAKFAWKAAVPPVPAAGATFHGATGGWNLAVSSKTANAQAAYDFIEYLTTTPDVQNAIAANTPALKAAATTYLAKRKYADVLQSVSETGMPRPKSPIYPQLSDIQQSGVQKILQGGDVATVLAEMQKEMESVIAKQ